MTSFSLLIINFLHKTVQFLRSALFLFFGGGGLPFHNSNNGDLYSVLTKISKMCFTYVQIKTLIKRDSITLATNDQAYNNIPNMPLDKSHITLHIHRNPYSTPGTNTTMIGSAGACVCAHTQQHDKLSIKSSIQILSSTIIMLRPNKNKVCHLAQQNTPLLCAW